MTEWKEYKFSELYKIRNGLSKGGSFFGSGYPFLTFSDVFNNYFIPENLEAKVETSEKERSSFNILRGDVFLTRTSETAEELGMSCIATKNYPNATYNGFTKRLRPLHGENIILPEFMGFYLRSPHFRAKFYALSGSMSTRASLSNGDLESMTISLPPFETQKKIAHVLFTINESIQNSNKIIANLHSQAKEIYKEWFIKYNIHKDFSEWEEIPLSEIIIEQPKSKIKVGDARNVTGKYPFYTSGSTILQYNEAITSGFSIFLNTGGIADVKYHVGKAAYSTDTWCIKGKDEYNHFLYLLLHSMIKELNFSYFEGSALKHLQKQKLKTKFITLPPLHVISEFNSLIIPIFELIGNTKEEIATLQQIQKKLISKISSDKVSFDNINI